MPIRGSKKLALVRRRQQVADLYLQGYRQTEIAERLGVGQPTVSTDLARVREEWRASTIRDFDAARDQELQKLDRIEREAWAAWKRSQQSDSSAVVSDDDTGQHTRKSAGSQVGDLRALDTLLKCHAARRAMLGLDAPTRIAPVMPNGEEPYRLAVAHLSLDELRALKRLRDRMQSLPTEQTNEKEELPDEDPRVN